MTPLPYALVDRICELGALLDEHSVAAVAELLRHIPDAHHAKPTVRHAHLLLSGEARAMLDIIVDTWVFIVPQTSGAEIGAALIAAAVQASRLQQ